MSAWLATCVRPARGERPGERMKSEPSYWLAFLNHPYNIGLMTGMFGAGVLASYPFGMDGLILTFLAFLAVEVIGLATVPALPSFRAAVNKEAERREVRETSARLLAEINQHGGSPHVRSYERMASRVESLYRIAADASTALSERDVAQLETLTLDYLRQCLSDSVLKGQDDEGVADSLKRQIRGLDQRIERGGLDADEKAQLTRARAEFERLLADRAGWLRGEVRWMRHWSRSRCAWKRSTRWF